MNDLVFVNYNTKLHEKTEKAKLLEEDGAIKYDHICLEELKFSSEWMMGIAGHPMSLYTQNTDGLTWAVRVGAYTSRSRNEENAIYFL